MMKDKILRTIVRALLTVLYQWLGKTLEREIGSRGTAAIHNALLCD